MKSLHFDPKRYQLKKDAARIVATGHPWIFRSHLSSAAEALRAGQWLKLVGPDNEIAGYGIHDTEGLIGIRVLKRGATSPDTAWIRKQIAKALAKRAPLRAYSDAFRAIHGENDGLPGVVVDIYKDTAVLQTYSPTVDALGRYVAQCLRRELGLASVIWKLPAKRKRQRARPVRTLYGTVPSLIPIREGKLTLSVSVGEGQKSGTFLDLRGLRKWVSQQPLAGKRVLNLFSYTGTLGLAAEMAGAREVWNVDISEGAIAYAKQHHTRDPKRHRFIAADVFDWLKTLPEKEKFDLIIVDPPQMASETTQVPNALHAYKVLYRTVAPHLARGGTLLACCCTSRIARKRFRDSVDGWLPPGLRFSRTLLPEDDHPVGFPEGDYLKINVYLAG